MTALADHRADIAAIRRLLDELDAAGAELLRRDATGSTRRDSLPARASGAEPGTSRPAARPRIDAWPETADATSWAWRCPCGHTGHSWPTEQHALAAGHQHAAEHGTSDRDYTDPTGEAAVADTQPDPVRRRARTMARKRRQVLDVLRDAVAQTLEPKLTDVELDANDGTWCTNHLAHGGHTEPISTRQPASGLCRPCYDFKVDPDGDGRLPGRPEIDYRHAHGRWPARHDRRRTTLKQVKRGA